MKDVDQELKLYITQALHEIEKTGDIVLVSPVLEGAARTIAEKTKEAYIGEIFSHEELVFFRQLVAEAAHNDKLFCGELQATTGYTKDTVEELLEKLRGLTSYY
ncbi:hypothetical protein [Marinomonas sp. THO17]|uniref:hypothetical protein n=1 Tax=Marinomonas sp. THO17 TaxID=3149048 RepID=UPI00336BC029